MADVPMLIRRGAGVPVLADQETYELDYDTTNDMLYIDNGASIVLIGGLKSSVWDRAGTVISPITAGDDVVTTGKVEGGTAEFGGAVNYAAFAADGEMTLHGNARVGNHITMHAEAFKLTGAKPAVVNSEGVFITLDFVHTTEKEAYASQFVPYRWDSDTDVEIIVCWFCDNDATGGDVTWGIEYRAIKDGEQVNGAVTTITQSFTGAGAGLAKRCIFTTKLLKANLEADDLLGIRIFRDHDDAGDTLNETARFLAVHLHFTRNKLGKAL